ncbi:cilium assembly protein DZIP1L [Vanessa cardui]|uniref:cilium assembly protein DZIP1L n=1 Tax=Vanessa cardui TaxID=171605 RepID=UPI001F13E724|nr:cilium assembly protein DZIP1L [Vanessa cardui]
MAHKTSYAFHHNFPNLAEESGFTFNTHKPRIHIEWNKIKMVDIDSIIRDRKFGLLEQHINDILGCVLESEFDVRILDEGVLKIFRLSQLAVEYQQFCRNYLDRSIYVMREEVTNLLKELETTRRSLKEKDEEIRKLKRKSKHSLRTPSHYGNENIAAMLLKTLNNTKGDIFNSTSHPDVLQYNKCSYCEKIFLNQLYLKSHMSRRHADIINIPQSEVPEKITANDNTNTKLNEEIEELKTKLKQMENLITNTRTNGQGEAPENVVQNVEPHSNQKVTKETKDAEVSTDENMKDKIDTWKKEEYEKYNQEIVLLRKQIIDIISNKEKQEQSSIQNDLKIMEQLQATIKQQSSEIASLKEELLKGVENEKEKRKEIENQMVFWVKQAEKQSNEYKVLLQKLNDVTNEAREYRARADAEKEKSSKLQDILDQHLSRTPRKESNQKNKINEEIKETNDVDSAKITEKTPTADLITLSQLQQKAQELLNMNDTSTCESTSTSDGKIKMKNVVNNASSDDKSQNLAMKKKIPKRSTKYSNDTDTVRKSRNKSENKSQNKINSIKHKATKKENSYVHIPRSPMKIVRAKVTEEVNQRLISLGVDPLRNRLPQNTFRKQRIILQKEQETKTKKLPVREKILHSIMAQLDESTANKNVSPRSDYISPNKSPKTFSLSSVFTNVKTKALSLVKSSESNNNTNKSYNDIAKKAIALLKTPPESTNTSPIIQRHSVISPNRAERRDSKSKRNINYQSSKSSTLNTNSDAFDVNNVSDDSNSQSSEQERTQKQKARVVNNLVKSPIRPTDIPDNQNVTEHRFFVNRDDKSHPKSNDLYQIKAQEINVNKKSMIENIDDSSDAVESIVSSPRKFYSEENINNFKQTKGVLKNASSTSSLNKKKVIFDMDAIQMKSLSASPSQSITEKSDNKEQIESGIVNLDTEEWDLSSIENEHPTSTVKVQVTSHTSPKVAELKKTIESQLTRRNPTLSTALVGGVDVLAAPIQKMTNFGGSNTSLGSSILDDTDSIPIQNKTFVKSLHVEKDDSEIEISDLINETIDNKTYVKSY